MNYTILKNILPIYSADYAFDEMTENSILTQGVQGEGRLAIKKEILSLLEEPDISLVEFLEEECLEAYCAVDENDAKGFIIERVWNVLFPDEKLPVPLPHSASSTRPLDDG